MGSSPIYSVTPNAMRCRSFMWSTVASNRCFPISRRKPGEIFWARNAEEHAQFSRGKEYLNIKNVINPDAWKFIAETVDIFTNEPRVQSFLKARHILLFAKSFMDLPALDPAHLNQCCYGIATARGVYSFCAYNNLHRFG